jgi:L-alanine-DL-glutamate epimerase-like enolase superfamily enzyme
LPIAEADGKGKKLLSPENLMSIIARIEVVAFRFPLADISLGDHSTTGVGNIIYKKGGSAEAERFAMRVTCDDGNCGEYVTHWVDTPSTFGQAGMLCPHLIGRDPEQHQLIFDDLKREIRACDHMAHVPGLGVEYDWDCILKHKTEMLVFD